MSFNAVASQICIRLLIIFLALTWLSIAGLRSALAHSAVVLRDRARSDRTKGSMLSITFENVMTDVFKSMVILALLSALFSTFGGMLLIHPRLLQENSNAHYSVGCFHFILSLAVLSVGGYVANHVHRYQGLFAGFDDKVSRFRYYKMMYYGGIGFAAVGIYPSVSRETTSLAWCTHSCAELRLRCYDCPVSTRGIKGYLGTWPDGRHTSIYINQFTFCFWSIHAVHLTVYTEPSWWYQQLPTDVWSSSWSSFMLRWSVTCFGPRYGLSFREMIAFPV
jgi:hypothetical protein